MTQRLTLVQVIRILLAVLILAIVAGIVVGVVVGKNSKKSSGTKLSGGSGSSNNPNVVNGTDPNDPSVFQKDPRLKPSFYGIAYTPEGSQLPGCGSSLRERTSVLHALVQLIIFAATIIQDIQV